MTQLLKTLKLVCQANTSKAILYNFTPQRGAAYLEKIVYNEPKRIKFYDPVRTGDLEELPEVNRNEIFALYKNSKELETANEEVKKIFSNNFQTLKALHKAYINEMMDKVRRHPYDNSSREVKNNFIITKTRAYYISLHLDGLHKLEVHRLIFNRRKELKLLRSEDYKKFEWLLDTLNLVYKPVAIKESYKYKMREKSLHLLTNLQIEKQKEEKVAELKKSFDQQKIPFLEGKIEKLKKIRQMEKENNLEETVTEEDIEECIKKLEKVKIEVAERKKYGYKRKIHPFFVQPFEEALLLENEQKGREIREKEIDEKLISRINSKTLTPF